MKLKAVKRRIAKAFRPRVSKTEKAAALLTHHVSTGDAFNAQREWLSAVEHYRKALDLSPGLVPIWVQLGHGLRETGQLDEAEAAYLRAAELEPDNQDALFFLGVTRSTKRPSAVNTFVKKAPEEKSLPAVEPQGFSFRPRDLPSSFANPATTAANDGKVMLYLCGHAVGLVAADAWEAGALARRMGELYTISHPGICNSVVSVNAAGTTPFEPVPRPLWLRDDARSRVVQGTEFGIADMWFINSRTLRLRFMPNDSLPENRVLRCFQYDPNDRQTLLLLTEQPIASDIPTFIDIDLADPYLALGFSLCTEDADLVSFALLPFPSLCRGGLHYGEICDDAAGKPYLAALEHLGSNLLAAALNRDGRPAIGHVKIDLDDATGTERIFRSSLLTWLRDVLGVSIGIGHVPDDMDAKVVAFLSSHLVDGANSAPAIDDQSAILRLPADAVPSLHCLMADWEGPIGSHVGSFILASAIDGVPKYRILPPRLAGDRVKQARGAQPFPVFSICVQHESSLETKGLQQPPLAIRFRRLTDRGETQLLAPTRLETASLTTTSVSRQGGTPAVSVVHYYSGNRGTLAAVLEALTLQHRNGELEVLVGGGEAEADAILELLHRFFPSCGRFVQCPDGDGEGARLNLVAAQARAERIFFLGDAVICHDPGTLLILSALLEMQGVASASCLLIGPKKTGRTIALTTVCAGYIASTAARTATLLESADMLLHLPVGAWPVAVNSSRLFMARRDEWKRIGGFFEEREPMEELGTHFWNISIREGLTHVMTTSTSATLLPHAGDVVERFRATAHFLPADDAVGPVSVTIRRLVA